MYMCVAQGAGDHSRALASVTRQGVYVPQVNSEC